MDSPGHSEVKDERGQLNRRKFLLGLFGTLTATGFTSPFLEKLGLLFALPSGGDYDPRKHFYGMGINVKKCIGCGRCAAACKEENNVPREPFFFRTWVERYIITVDGEAIVDSPNGGIGGFPPRGHRKGNPALVLRSQALQSLR